jgi:hypothetical protein
MPRSNDEGLFLVTGKKHRYDFTGPTFCRINEIQVITPPTPSKDKLFIYSVCYWSADPIAAEFATPPEIVTHANSGQHKFAFIGQIEPDEVRDLETLCIQHFLQKPAVEISPETEESLRGKILPLTKIGVVYQVYSIYDETPSVQVKEIYKRKDFVPATLGQPPEPQDEKVVCLMLDNSIEELDAPTGNQWMKETFAELMAPEIFRRYSVKF